MRASTLKTLKSNYERSRIDYVMAFLNLWVSFNTWYNQHSSQASEKDRVLDVAANTTVRSNYDSSMMLLNDPAFDDNFSHIVQTVEDASITVHYDRSGLPIGRQYTDTTGFKYRLICNRMNTHIQFLKECCGDSELQDWTCGLNFFLTNSRRDELFGRLYIGYQQHIATVLGSQPFDALNDIPNEIRQLGAEQFGSLLFYDMSTIGAQGQYAQLSDIFDSKTMVRAQRTLQFAQPSDVRRRYPKAGRKGALYRACEIRGLDIFERELFLLYKFRSSIVHGDRDLGANSTQKLAEVAYRALDDICAPAYGN